METAIKPAGPPREGEYFLQWRSPLMPGPAFWYFKTKEEAQAARVQILTRRAQRWK